MTSNSQTHNVSDNPVSAQPDQRGLELSLGNIPVPQPLFRSKIGLPDPAGGIRIYVSSTSIDLLEHRRAVIEMLRKCGYSYLAQEEYVAEDRWPLEKCLDDVDQCNVYLGFFAWRYGFVPPGHQQAITEQEYRRARRNGATCLCFLLHEDFPWPKKHVDADQTSIEALRKDISQSALIGFFRNEDNLAVSVATALDKLSKDVAGRIAQSTVAPTWEGTLENCLPPALRGEFEGAVARARRHLLQPLPGRFTDHSIEQKRRLHVRLNTLLLPWALQERKTNEARTQVELFVLLTAIYVHDLGLWPAFDAERLPQLIEKCPSPRKALEAEGYPLPLAGVPCSRQVMRFLQQHHHLITEDVLTRPELGFLGDPVPNVGLRSPELKPLVANVCTLQNEWQLASNPLLKAPYENRFGEPLVDAGPIRVAMLAAFLRLALALDLDHKRLDIDRLCSPEFSDETRARYWKHHFVKTCRIEPGQQSGGVPVRLAFRLPEAYDDQRDWLEEALYSATADALRVEVRQMGDWLGPTGVWLRVEPRANCQFETDVTGQTRPMPENTLRVFRRIHPLPRMRLMQQELRQSLEDDVYSADRLVSDIPSLVLHDAITHYLTAVEHVFEEDGFRDRPYTALELDYSGSQREALDLLIEFVKRTESPVRPVVVVGDPGGGKTTLLRRFVLELTQRPDCEQFVPIFVEAKFFGDERWANAFLDRIAQANDARQAATFGGAVG